MSFSSAALATPKHCPPGHAQKGWCEPGQRYYLPKGADYRVYPDWKKRGWKAPGRGGNYVIVDDEVFLIIDATREVLEAVGAVGRVLK
ncbi:hypothetical protein KHP62_14535 [Rhodobacteraceae bacterium NNCM2]|nr:hypothetical protein [Coraliihabitans acroporae]